MNRFTDPVAVLSADRARGTTAVGRLRMHDRYNCQAFSRAFGRFVAARTSGKRGRDGRGPWLRVMDRERALLLGAVECGSCHVQEERMRTRRPEPTLKQILPTRRNGFGFRDKRQRDALHAELKTLLQALAKDKRFRGFRH